MKQELKPCYCGSDAKQIPYGVRCRSCGLSLESDLYSQDELIEKWNARPDHSGESAEIDWEQRRYEIAKDCVSATLSRTHIIGGEIKDVVGYSIRVADELINQLKQQDNE